VLDNAWKRLQVTVICSLLHRADYLSLKLEWYFRWVYVRKSSPHHDGYGPCLLSYMIPMRPHWPLTWWRNYSADIRPPGYVGDTILYSKHVWDDHQRCPLQSDLDGHWWQQPNRWIRHSRCSAKLIGSLPQWQLISFGVLSDRYTFQGFSCWL